MALAALEHRPTAVDACAAALRDAVLAGELGVGVRLPPERALAATFGVNRVTVRNALARLVAEGLLSVRQGSGYLVQDFLRSGGLDLALALALRARGPRLVALVRDLLEVRRGLARTVLERLVRRRPSKDALAALGAAVDAMERQAQAGADARALARADLDVLCAVVAATGSEVLRLTLNPVAEVLLGVPALVKAMFQRPAQNVLGWRALAQWLAAPKAEGLGAVLAVVAAHDEATLAALKQEAR